MFAVDVALSNTAVIGACIHRHHRPNILNENNYLVVDGRLMFITRQTMTYPTHFCTTQQDLVVRD